MFDVAWGMSLRTGAVVSAAQRHPARCPCCRQELSLAAGCYRHPAGHCTVPRVEQALAWRVAMARFSSGRPPQLQEHCVCCGDPVGPARALPGGGPGGGEALWVSEGLALSVGWRQRVRPDIIRVRSREVLGSDGDWDAVARRRCAPCAGAQARLDRADAAARQEAQDQRARAHAQDQAASALDRAAARWGLTAAWGPYQLAPHRCAGCGAEVVRYRWDGPPPAPRPASVWADGRQQCAACGVWLRDQGTS